MKIIKLFTGFKLAEGPIYLNSLNTLVWVDIEGCKIHFYNEYTKIKDSFSFEEMVGCVLPYKGSIIVCAVGQSLVYFDLKNKEILKTVKIFDNEKLRFNDGKCDKDGNLWIGTMAKDYDDKISKNLGSLYCIKDDIVIKKYDDFSIPNGLDWIENYFFHIDTPENTVYRYEVSDGYILKNKIPFLTDFEASPDGMTIDKDNNFWIALWGGKKVVCYSYKTKAKIDEIHFDDLYTSCVSFGSKNYASMFVTSAKDKNHEGSIYKIKSKYQGKEPNTYKGTLT